VGAAGGGPPCWRICEEGSVVFVPLDDEIKNTPSSVTFEYSRWLMGREWPWHTSGVLAGACMAIATRRRR
jgi:hypothetical protein